MTVPRRLSKDATGVEWQYHPRSDHHSKVACWGIVFDLLQHCPLLVDHIASGQVAFGVNHRMTNFTNNKPKDLDLVICRPSKVTTGQGGRSSRKKGAGKTPQSFREMVAAYGIVLTPAEQATLSSLPDVPVRPVGSVLVALEAKAAMTAFKKALPRLYAELDASHVTVHGDTDHAIAAGLAMVNMASEFVSPTNNLCVKWGAPIKVSKHVQPAEAAVTVAEIDKLPRRNATGMRGFDALCAVVVECTNKVHDKSLPIPRVRLVSTPPAPPSSSVLHYEVMIDRISGMYASRFGRG